MHVSQRQEISKEDLNTTNFPKIIWIMWLQGLDNAPRVVRECYRSWQVRNPNWEIRFLDANNYHQYADLTSLVDTDRSDLSMQHLADIVRIRLLADHGGVWVDATCFCCRPLDEWIYDVMDSGFFCFMGHRKDTVMSNWFMSAQQDSYMAKLLASCAINYWRQNHFPEQINLRIYTALKVLLNQHPLTTCLWFAKPVRQWLKIRPYFWFHYMFADLCRKDKKFSKLWTTMPKLNAHDPHKILYAGYLNPVTEEIRNAVDNRADRVYKLNWKLHKFDSNCDGDTFPKGSNIDYVLCSLGQQ